MFWKIIAGIKAFLEECRKDNISAYAAQSAFFIIMSLIPFVMLFISLIQYTPVTESMVMETINRLMPDYIAPFLIGIIHEVGLNKMTFSILFLLSFFSLRNKREKTT